MYAYLREEVEDAVSEETLRAFCARSLDNAAWLEAQGAHFTLPSFAAKTTQPPDGYGLCSLDSALFPGPCLTLGGLRVEGRSGRALRADGSQIPGLYAAGRSAVGVASRSYVSGLSLADCVFSGRNACRDAAERAVSSQAGFLRDVDPEEA